MAQAADVFLEHVSAVRSIRHAASIVAERAGITSGVDAICALFIAGQIGGEFCSKDIIAIGRFNPCFSIKTLLASELLEQADGQGIDRRRRPLRLTDKGRHIIAQLEAAMAPAVEGERVAA